MRFRAILAIVIIDIIIALLGFAYVTLDQPEDLSRPVTITILSMVALTFGLIWGEGHDGHTPGIKKPLSISFLIIAIVAAMYAAMLADGDDPLGIFGLS